MPPDTFIFQEIVAGHRSPLRKIYFLTSPNTDAFDRYLKILY